jgi:PHS family inorganic phosphate transporter-like MFS transporter
LVVCMAGLLPSCYAPFFLVGVWGQRPIQLLSFAMLTVLLAIQGKVTTHQDSGVV